MTATYIDPAAILAARTTPKPAFYSASGYGRKIPTRYMLQLADKRWRRVYVCQISNAGTSYVLVGKAWHCINGEVETAIEAKLSIAT